MTTETAGGNSPRDLARYVQQFGNLTEAFIHTVGITMGNNPPTRNQLIATTFTKECYETARSLYDDLIARCEVDVHSQEVLDWDSSQWASNAGHLNWYLNKYSHLMEA